MGWFAHHGGGEGLCEAQAQYAAVRALRSAQDPTQRVALLLRGLLLRCLLSPCRLALLLRLGTVQAGAGVKVGARSEGESESWGWSRGWGWDGGEG